MKLFEILLIGDSWTGKSNIFTQIISNKFNFNSFGTIGIQYSKKYFYLSSLNNNIPVLFWDISGRKTYWDISITSLRHIDGIILVYDITKRETFESLNFWIEKITKHFPLTPILLLGNKIDLEEYRTVSREEGEKFAFNLGITLFYEVSAKDGKGISESINSFISVLQTLSSTLESFEVASKDDMSVAYDSYESSRIATTTISSTPTSISTNIIPTSTLLSSSPSTTTTTTTTQTSSPISTLTISNTNSNIRELLFGQETKEIVIEHLTYDKQRKLADEKVIHSPGEILSDEELDFEKEREEKKSDELKLPYNPTISNYRYQDAVPLSLSGMAGGYGSIVNGIYLPTNQFEDNWPVYKKVFQKSDNHSNHIEDESQEMFLSFQAFYKKKRRHSSTSSQLSNNHLNSIMSPAWIIKNKNGKIYARIVLDIENIIDYDSNEFAIDKIQFNEKGKRTDIQWEMRSSVGVLGFRKRPAAVIRPASMIQLKSLPEVKDETLDLYHQILQDIDQQKNITTLDEDNQISSYSTVDTIYRVILLGESSVGKTNLIQRYHEGKYKTNLPKSVSVDITPAEAECLDGRHLKCQLWDTSGDYNNWKLVSLYLRYPLGGVSGILLVYDISNRESFLMIEKWIERLQSLSIYTPMILHLIGTKSDLDDYGQRRVSFEEGIALAEKYFMTSFVETSSRDGTGVIEAFQQILTDLICFDDNAKQWIKTTRPTYRRRSITFPNENFSQNKSDLSNSIVGVSTNSNDSHNNNNNNNYNHNHNNNYINKGDDQSDDENATDNSHQKTKNISSNIYNNITEIELVNRSGK